MAAVPVAMDQTPAKAAKVGAEPQETPMKLNNPARRFVPPETQPQPQSLQKVLKDKKKDNNLQMQSQSLSLMALASVELKAKPVPLSMRQIVHSWWKLK